MCLSFSATTSSQEAPRPYHYSWLCPPLTATPDFPAQGLRSRVLGRFSLLFLSGALGPGGDEWNGQRFPEPEVALRAPAVPDDVVLVRSGPLVVALVASLLPPPTVEPCVRGRRCGPGAPAVPAAARARGGAAADGQETRKAEERRQREPLSSPRPASGAEGLRGGVRFNRLGHRG